MSKEGKMSDNSKEIAKKIQRVREIDKKSALSKKLICAECLHRKNGSYALVRSDNRGPGGGTEWHCKNCGAKIELKQIDQKELLKAIDTVYQACNMVKLTARPDVSEKDASLVKMVSDMMFRLDAYLPQMYQAALSNKGANHDRKNGRKNGSNIMWGTAGSM